MKSRIILLGIFLIILFQVAGVKGGSAADQAQATFVVSWYDVGVYALEGRSGVLSVERGWRGSSEINTVIYDPGKIGIGEMEKFLRKSGTYIKTIEDSE